MTLSFSQKWSKSMGELAGQPNYFVEKIWESLTIYKTLRSKGLFDLWYDKVEAHGIDLNINCIPKLHTIRQDTSDRWRADMDIHFVINNRTKERFQFAPVIKCVSVQSIEIKHTNTLIFIRIEREKRMVVFDVYNPETKKSVFGRINKLAINDGFPSVEAFFDFFNKDFRGVLIHWTDLKY